jgi:hypothetical protein
MKANRKAGYATMAAGAALPAATFLVSQSVLAADAARGGPPNQGLMVVAYLATRAALGVGLLLVLVGVVVIARARRG